ncbi:MAG TPA: 4Fe-4S dicluster domain-containing protein [Planctomycetota bacterium]|jgi:ferredoxin
MVSTITTENLARLAEQLLGSGQRVIAPARVAGMVVYKELSAAQEMLPDSAYVLPHASFKEFLFPRTECVLRYKFNEGKIDSTPAEPDKTPQVIIGSRPCDAASLPILDSVFGWDYKDAFYFQRRQNTTIISIACSKANESCYCTSVGHAPDETAGSDLLLKRVAPASVPAGRDAGTTTAGTEAGATYLVEVVTDKGKALLEKHAACFQQVDSAPATEVVKLEKKFDAEKIKPWLDTHFEDPLWQQIATKCMGCGTCAFGCPTCHCFDIVDEGDNKGGCRLKNWDTCGSSLFTLHGSGHNPRNKQEQRYRQRVMHKFKYYVEKFGQRACVGCGRCSDRCPVDMDLRGVLETIAKKEA